MSKHGFYAGSFDPITNGHLWVIEKGIELFDHLVIAIGTNAKKKGYFTLVERIEMINNACNERGINHRVKVVTYANDFLFNAALNHGCQYILRGIRNTVDFEYELELKRFNEEMNPKIETVFVMPPANLANRSSSLVKGCVGLNDWENRIQNFTTPYVISKFKERIEADH